MSRRLWWLFPVMAAVACTGLYLEQGNAYPCDFSEGPGLRDAVCQPGDVCGLDNVCRKYIYEGPRFEAGIGLTVPAYGPGSGEGKVLHPLVLNQKIEFITHEVVPGGSTFLTMKDGNDALQLFELDFLGTLTKIDVPLPPMASLSVVTSIAPFTDEAGARKVLIELPTRVAVGDLAAGTLLPLAMGKYRSVIVPELSFDAGVLLKSIATPVVWDDTRVSVVRQQQPTGTWAPIAIAMGQYDDVAAIPTPNSTWLVMVKNNMLELHTLGVGLASTIPLDPLLLNVPATIRTDVAGRVVVVARGNVLSTFQVNVSGGALTLTRAWPDCRPCGRVLDPLTQLSPTSIGTVRVELVCGLDQDGVGVVVTGSIARSQSDACTTEDINLLPQARRFRSATWDSQAGVLLGGQRGEVWLGESFSSVMPAYLDRVPLDVAPASVAGTPVTAALTEDYLAVQQEVGVLGLNNGFRRVPTDELKVGANTKLGGFVHGIANWGVTTEGELVALNADPLKRFGPTLLRASSEPITSTIGGEAFVLADGGSIFFLAADDSLYQVSNPDELLSARRSDEVVLPDLTPEPSVPIRSLALERTPLGTGEDYARGYLVTSRTVFAWELGGSPLRWSSTPLELSSGEPLEVWFDSARSALGRVGFSDGQISTLPGGYQLAEPLPPNEEVAPQVLDYENLGGWPVAYATTGVFIAGWDLKDGKLQNRFPDGGINRPMTWREVTLDGANPKPWMRDGGILRPTEAKPGRLFVSVDPPVAADGGKEQTYKLLLFLDDQVLQIARHVRYLQ